VVGRVPSQWTHWVFCSTKSSNFWGLIIWSHRHLSVDLIYCLWYIAIL
jgi:hypothetical protein